MTLSVNIYFNIRTSDCSGCIDYDLANDLVLLSDEYAVDISRPRFFTG